MILLQTLLYDHIPIYYASFNTFGAKTGRFFSPQSACKVSFFSPQSACKVSSEIDFWAIWLKNSNVDCGAHFCGNGGPSKNRLLQSYEVLWIHVIDAICLYVM